MTEVKEERVLATNRAAFHNYHISTKYEAGAALTGTEVKSVLDGRIQLKDSYVAIRDGEAWLFNAHISPYAHGNRANHEPLRTRKLLLHRREIDKLDQAAGFQGREGGRWIVEGPGQTNRRIDRKRHSKRGIRGEGG